MKLIDCFMYFDENLILDIRFNTLKDHVNEFVIVEAKKSHSGNEKKINFKIENFPKFKDKIKYFLIDLPSKVESNKKGWHKSHIRDQLQRNALKKGYENSSDNDLIMISDIDEIPNPNKIKEFNFVKNKYACFIQKNFHLKLNLLNKTKQNWAGTKICVKKYLKSPQWLRNLKTKNRPFWKIYKSKTPQLILDGGWHFNDLKDVDGLRAKIMSSAHQEENIPEISDLKKISSRLSNLKDIRGRNYEYKKVNIDNSYPKYIINNFNKFKDWII